MQDLPVDHNISQRSLREASSLARLLEALADPVRLEVLSMLLAGPATQKRLGEELGLTSGTMSRQMSMLEQADLVVRARSHGPYEVKYPRRLLELLRTAADLQLLQLEGLASTAEREARARREQILQTREGD